MLVSDINISTYECKNALSARKDPDSVTALIQDELVKGFIQGTFLHPPFSVYRVSPIGIAVHKYSFKKRLILDLSSPHNSCDHDSVNDLIDKDLCSLSYIKVDDAINAIQDYGVNSICCKVDVCDAFKQLGILPTQWHLFCFKWHNFYYHYVILPSGCRSSPKLFDMLSRSICWIAKHNYNINVIFHLLDDFLTVDRPTDCGERTMALLSLIFNKLSIPLSKKKTVGPSCVLEYLGIVLDTVNMQARLPQDKVKRITDFITLILSKKSCTRKELEQLLRHLNFATRVILLGRSFVSYLYKLMSSVKESFYHVHLNKECKADLYMWLSFLKNWNGINFFYEKTLTKAADMMLYTDASSLIGFGGFDQHKWFCDRWSDNLPCKSDFAASMAFLELYPIVVAAVLWGKEWCGKRILFYCDNLATVHIIAKGRSKETNIMKLMRKLTMCAATYNFAVYSEHLPGKSNEIADALSR
ncbi:unnamed protein product [Mytilus edulis]|uniref:Reverse transcriptase domain-containing protein n=1 Tax=Mytilus edulis TaxID=6550 RepID=A0A8S3SNC2_MYTED|nr:unnamed protein product [Mytilus edulis]